MNRAEFGCVFVKKWLAEDRRWRRGVKLMKEWPEGKVNVGHTLMAMDESACIDDENNVFAWRDFVGAVTENDGRFNGYYVSVASTAQNDDNVFKMSFDNEELLRGWPCQSPWIKVNSNHEQFKWSAMQTSYVVTKKWRWKCSDEGKGVWKRYG